MTTSTHIVSVAEDMLRRFPQQGAEVDVEQIARALGIEIRRGNLGDHTSGAIYREKGNTVIGVNSTQSPVRQRFTIAHELGHFELHRDKDLWVDSDVMFRSEELPRNSHELEANAFAAELLMPRAFIMKEEINPHPQKLSNTISRLTKKYNVSMPAMTRRLVELKLVPVF